MGIVVRSGALALLLSCLVLGTAPLEISLGLALGVGLWCGDRRSLPMFEPLLAVAFCLAFAALGHSSAVWIEAAGRCWPLLGVIAVPMLVGRTHSEGEALGPKRIRDLEQVGLVMAATAGLWAVTEAALLGRWPWLQGVDGPFSHHLTLGYALLIPLARALQRRAWVLGTIIALGVGCAGASGPLLSGGVMLVALMGRPRLALVGGSILALGIMQLLAVDPELYQRVVLWAGGVGITVSHPFGLGPGDFRDGMAIVQSGLDPDFHFPLHAHDSALQFGVMAGLGSWVVGGWFLWRLWQLCGRAGRAAIAAMVVGSLTQDTLGDLEVIRALTIWCLLPEIDQERVDSEV